MTAPVAVDIRRRLDVVRLGWISTVVGRRRRGVKEDKGHGQGNQRAALDEAHQPGVVVVGMLLFGGAGGPGTAIARTSTITMDGGGRGGSEAAHHAFFYRPERVATANEKGWRLDFGWTDDTHTHTRTLSSLQ